MVAKSHGISEQDTHIHTYTYIRFTYYILLYIYLHIILMSMLSNHSPCHSRRLSFINIVKSLAFNIFRQGIPENRCCIYKILPYEDVLMFGISKIFQYLKLYFTFLKLTKSERHLGERSCIILKHSIAIQRILLTSRDGSFALCNYVS